MIWYSTREEEEDGGEQEGVVLMFNMKDSERHEAMTVISPTESGHWRTREGQQRWPTSAYDEVMTDTEQQIFSDT